MHSSVCPEQYRNDRDGESTHIEGKTADEHEQGNEEEGRMS